MNISLDSIRERDAAYVVTCEHCAELPGHYFHTECPAVVAGGRCIAPEDHHGYEPAKAPRSYNPGEVESWDRRALLAMLDAVSP